MGFIILTPLYSNKSSIFILQNIISIEPTRDDKENCTITFIDGGYITVEESFESILEGLTNPKNFK